MEDFKEFQGKSLDETIREACSYFDAPREKLEIDIVQDAKKGIFGVVGTRKAIIRARRAEVRSKVSALLGREGEPPNKRKPARSTEPTADAVQDKAQDKQEKAQDKPKRRQPRRDNAQPAAAMPQEHDDNRGNRLLADASIEDDTIGNRLLPEDEPDDAIGNRIDAGRGSRARQDVWNEDPWERWERERPRPVGRHQEAGLRTRDDETNPRRKPRLPKNDQPRPPRAERQERPDRPDRTERTERMERTERPERAERMERPDRTERIERPERAERPRTPRQERLARPYAAQPQGDYNRRSGAAPSNASVDDEAMLDNAVFASFNELDHDKLLTVATDTASRIVGHILGETPVAVNLLENRVNVHVNCGEDSGLLIGREGQTLAALQYITSRIVSRIMEAPVRVQFDVGDYRERQDDRLHDLALSLAERVRTTGRPCSTRPMSSYHRRLVHMALQEVPDIQTRSFGEGSLKRVIIQRRRQERS